MKPNIVLISIITLLVAVAAYWFFFTGTGNQPPLSVDAGASSSQMQFAAAVGELESISFKTSIFSDARFNALVDIATPITPESFRRSDPFAPTAASGSSVPAARPAAGAGTSGPSDVGALGTSSPATNTTNQ